MRALLLSDPAASGKAMKGASDFFVGGRSFNAGLLFTTLIAANIGAGSTVGVTGLAYKFGVSSWWWIGCSGLGSLILPYIGDRRSGEWLRNTTRTPWGLPGSAVVSPCFPGVTLL